MALDIQRALRTAAWKLTLRRMSLSALVAVGGGAGLWAVAVLIVGPSPRVLLALCIAAGVGLLASFMRARTSVLEAARRVEQAAGWQERLSTAVELETAGSESAFRKRLAAEAEALLARHSPAAFIEWNLQRPAVIAGALVVAAIAVTALVPDGTHQRAALSAERRAAAGEIESAMERARAAGLDDLRAELAGILKNIRESRPLEDIRGGIDRALGSTVTRLADNVTAEAKRMAEAMGKSPALRELAGAVERLDANGVRAAGGNLASRLTTMPEAELRGAASSLTSTAEGAKTPGLSSPVWEMKRAAEARDATLFRTFSTQLGGYFAQEQARIDREKGAFDPIRAALTAARAALGGGAKGGTAEERMDFFVASKGSSDNATGMGNLIVRSRPDDIKTVYEGTRAVDTTLPQLPALIEDAQGKSDRGEVPSAYRDYVRRYFSADNDAHR